MVIYSQIKKNFPNIFNYFCSDDTFKNDSHYFCQFSELIPIYMDSFAFIEENLRLIDSENSKNILKNKCEKYIIKNGKDWSQFIDVINEIEGYKYLKQVIKCTKVDFIAENKKTKTPDLEGMLNNKKYYLEVKTIHTSDNENIFLGSNTIRSVPQKLEEGLFEPKLKSTIGNAIEQLHSISANDDIKIILLVISLDSDAPETIKIFTEQIKNYVKDALSELNNFEFIIKYKQNGVIYSHEDYQEKFGL